MIDSIIDFFTSYIRGIYQAWKVSKTIKRRLERKDVQKQVSAIVDDMAIARIQLSRIFSLPGFSLYNCSVHEEKLKEWNELFIPSFPLKLFVEARYQLDQMKRDLSLINKKQIQKYMKNSVKDFFISFIPNPMDLFIPWKDLFILSFIMKYSKNEICEMYVDFVNGYKKILFDIVEGSSDPHIDMENYQAFYEYEDFLVNQLAKDDEKLTQDEIIEECKKRIQRLIQVLCNPGNLLKPKKWKLPELYIETLQKTQENIYSLEFTRRLRAIIERILLQKNQKLDLHEQMLNLYEKKELMKSYRFQQKLHFHFIV